MYEVYYWFYIDNAHPIEKKVGLDYDKIKRDVLLSLYYAEIVKIKEYSRDVLQFLYSQIYIVCCANEESYMSGHVAVLHSEVMRVLAKIYSEGMIITEEENGDCLVRLSSNGKEECLKYL